MNRNMTIESPPTSAAPKSLFPDWAVNAVGYTCFVGALMAEGLVAVFSAVTGTKQENLPSPLGRFMGREP